METPNIQSRNDLKEYWLQIRNHSKWDASAFEANRQALLPIASNLELTDWEKYLKAMGNYTIDLKNSADQLSSFVNEAKNNREHYEECLLADGLFSLGATYGMLKKDTEALNNYDELILHFKEHPDDTIAQIVAKAITNANVIARNNELEDRTKYLEELKNLLEKHNTISIRELLAKTLSNESVRTNSSAIQPSSHYLPDLRKLAQEYNEQGIIEQLGRALVNITSQANRNSDIKTATACVEELRTLYTQHPSPAVQKELAKCLFNYSLVSQNTGNIESAFDACLDAEALLKPFTDEEAQLLKEKTSIRKNRLGIELKIPEEKRTKKLSTDTRNEADEPPQRAAMVNALDCVIATLSEVRDSFLEQMEIRKKRIARFLSPYGRFSDDVAILMILRQWNSYTPIIVDGQEYDRGGGYFLRYNNIGLVIDPGYNFIELFHKSGCKIVDITHIAITHAHDDHTAQLEQLLTLFHQYNDNNKTANKTVTLLLNHSTLKKFSGFNLHKGCPYINRVVCLNAFDPRNIQKINLDDDGNLSITVLKAYHDDIITTDYAVGLGLRIKFGQTIRHIVFTGDTGCYPPKFNNGKQSRGKYLNALGQECDEKLVDSQEDKGIARSYPEDFRHPNIDLLIPHLGSIKEYEFAPLKFEPIKSTSDPSCPSTIDPDADVLGPLFYPNHLGILGTTLVINELRPKAVILSEFGSELRGLRMQIAKILQDSLGKIMGEEQMPFIIPGDPSIVYNIAEGQFLCHEDGKYYNHNDLEAKEVGGDRIGIFKKNSIYASLDRFDKSMQELINIKNEDNTTFSLPFINDKENN